MSKRKRTVVCFIAALSVAALCGMCYAAKPVVKKAPSKSMLKIEMISIPKGSFLMGNSGVGDDKKYSRPDELPQHSVFLAAYSIGKYEVTRGQYKQFMKAGGYSNKSYWSDDGWKWKVNMRRIEPNCWAAKQTWGKQTFTQTDNHPVVGVSYYEAEAFCKWAGGHLPTEAQWERAARWNSKTKHANIYPWGDVSDAEKCNNYAGGGYQRYQTSPVGSYPGGASPSGCQDMAGNVWEWCKGWYYTYYSQSPSSDPQGPARGYNGYRVLRGGGWLDNASSYRCAYRYNNNPNNYDFNVGFRLVR